MVRKHIAGFFKDLHLIRKLLIVILTPIVLLPLPLIDGTQKSACGYVILIVAVFWLTEALPIAVSALLPVFLFPMVGLLPVKEASQQYINDKSMLFVGGFIVAAAIERWNIHRRIAIRIMLLFGTEPRWIMLGLMLPTWFISMWICNTSTTALMLPIAYAILQQLKETDKDISNQIKCSDHTDGVHYLDASTPSTGYMQLRVNEKMHGETNGGLKEDYPGEANGRLKIDCRGTRAQEITIDVKVPAEKQNVRPSLCNGDLVKEDFDKSLEEEDDPKFIRLCKALTLGIAYSANVGGIATMTGSLPNLVFMGIQDKLYKKEYGKESPITFANWMGFGVPTSLVLLILVWVWLQIFFLRSLFCCRRRDKYTAERIKVVLREEYQKLGPVTFGQGAVIFHFLILIVLWITRDMGGEVGWGNLFRDSFIKEAVPAMLIASILFVFPSKIPRVFCCRNTGTREEPQPLLSWRYAVDRVPWGVIFLLGSGFAFANASKVSGLSKWLGLKLSGLDYLDPWVLNLVLCYIVAAFTEIISNPAVISLTMPLIAGLATELGINILYLMFPATIATSFAFMLPVASPPNTIAFSYGYVKVIDMVCAGFILNVICVLVLVGSTETIGESLFNFSTLPSNMTAP